MSECVRCGQCCISVGRSFWTHGDFDDYPELRKIAEQTEHHDDGLPCEMLQMKDGIAACKKELLYGKAAKPKVCRDYPPLSCLHFNPQIEKGRTICYLQSG